LEDEQMRDAILAALALVALLFAASALAVDLSRVLPKFELPATPSLRAKAPAPQTPPAVVSPQAPVVAVDPVKPSDQGASAQGALGATPADASLPAGNAGQTAPVRRERGWREMLPGLLHSP